jgi:predicted CoA-binding protein
MKHSTSKELLTVVLGASTNPNRYSFLAIDLLQRMNFNVRAVGIKDGYIGKVKIEDNLPTDEPIDTVTLYLNENNQSAYLDKLIELKPRRIIFNPGTESDENLELFESSGIECIEACTLVMLRTNQY